MSVDLGRSRNWMYEGIHIHIKDIYIYIHILIYFYVCMYIDIHDRV